MLKLKVFLLLINFPFETSQINLITQNDIEKASQGLINIASHIGIIDKKIEIPTPLLKEFDDFIDKKKRIKFDKEIERLNSGGMWK